jgi:hypothetical protein
VSTPSSTLAPSPPVSTGWVYGYVAAVALVVAIAMAAAFTLGGGAVAWLGGAAVASIGAVGAIGASLGRRVSGMVDDERAAGRDRSTR